MLVPAMAFAEEAAADSGSRALAAFLSARPWRLVSRWAFSALAAGYAQAKIGSAGAGTLAERPEVSIWIITLQALPEVIVLLGFVSAILISG